MAVTELQVHGTPALAVHAGDGARVVVALHGGHVLSWSPAGGHGEQLYLSPRSVFAEGQAIRGGVPVVFPQFSDRGVLPKHGFARNRAWQLLRSDDDADGHASLVLGLKDDAASHAVWPHGFALELRLRLHAQELDMTLHCTNPGPDPWSFAAALHTYVRVSDCAQVRIAGLSGRPFHDAVDGQDKTQFANWLTIPGEVDRVYPGVDAAVDLHDPGAGGIRVVRVEHHGFSDTVVWNPGAQRCAGLPDMPANGYRSMVCIESGRITAPVLLAATQSWTGTQRLHLLA